MKNRFYSFLRSRNDGASLTGFTLIELLVVLAIMGLLMMAISVNLVNQRAERSVMIAKNELSSHLRKIQSYSLSGRQLPNGASANYYVVRFDFSRPNQYSILGIFDIYNNPRLVDVETVALPKDVIIDSVVINRSSSLSPSSFAPSSCALLAFRLPFSKIYADAVNLPDSCAASSPQAITSADRYNDFLTFITNTNAATVSTDFIMTISLKHSRTNFSKQVQIQGATGNIIAL